MVQQGTAHRYPALLVISQSKAIQYKQTFNKIVFHCPYGIISASAITILRTDEQGISLSQCNNNIFLVRLIQMRNVCCWKFQNPGRVFHSDKRIFFMRDIIICTYQVRTAVNVSDKPGFNILNDGMFLRIEVLKAYFYSQCVIAIYKAFIRALGLSL